MKPHFRKISRWAALPILAFLIVAALAQAEGQVENGYLPIVAGNYPGAGMPSQTAKPATQTATPTLSATRSATSSSTGTSSPTATQTSTQTPTQTPTSAGPSDTPVPTPTSSGGTSYISIGAQIGISHTHQTDNFCNTSLYGTGSAWADVDNDGDLDVFTTNHGGTNHLYPDSTSPKQGRKDGN